MSRLFYVICKLFSVVENNNKVYCNLCFFKNSILSLNGRFVNFVTQREYFTQFTGATSRRYHSSNKVNETMSQGMSKKHRRTYDLWHAVSIAQVQLITVLYRMYICIYIFTYPMYTYMFYLYYLIVFKFELLVCSLPLYRRIDLC